MLFRFASASALVAAATMAATPLAAADFARYSQPSAASAIFGSNSVNARDYRWHRRDRVDAGDVIAGVLVLGTIAAVASAASKSSRDRDYRYPQRYPAPDQRYDYRSGPTDWRRDDSRGIDRAVDVCTREIERNARIDTIDGVTRNGRGWRVSGSLANGDPFSCSIGSDGRIDGVDYGRREAYYSGSQWDDDRYAAARQAQDGGTAPAYPGGPIGENPKDQDVYDQAQTPDFTG